MKKIAIVISICLCGISAMAQEDIYKTLAAETCDCISKRNLNNSNKREIEMALGLCMLERIQANNIEVDISDEVEMRKLGEKVGMQMAPICPSVFSAFAESDSEQSEESVSTLTLTGKIKSVEASDFIYMVLKEDSGKEHKLIWLRYFPGSDEFKDDPKKLVGKKVMVTYQDMECYMPKAKIYYNTKEIRELTLEN